MYPAVLRMADRYVMYVNGFRPTFFINVDGWDPRKVETVMGLIKEADPKAHIRETERYPNWFNFNRKVDVLEIKPFMVKRLVTAFKGPQTFSGYTEMIHLHHSDIKVQNQLLYHANLRICGWFRSDHARMVREGIYETNMEDMVISERIDLDLRTAYVRIRCISLQHVGKRPYAAQWQDDREYH